MLTNEDLNTLLLTIVGFFLVRHFLRHDKMLETIAEVQKVIAVQTMELKYHDEAIEELYSHIEDGHRRTTKRGSGEDPPPDAGRG